ncbi:hypothetical protein QBC37DRAFT_374073 [Rhypophila decipiens]|uniref:CCHC-type domain-containing protein n=1 Tax=Rhypophila decipiens TaxID=261697 RepID=A0AAN6YB61_9PEZI|nr:hypothetical protein QBC37DRAFT_374073 [Rhypophila decipiens]
MADGFPPSFTCSRCGEVGHTEASCWRRPLRSKVDRSCAAGRAEAKARYRRDREEKEKRRDWETNPPCGVENPYWEPSGDRGWDEIDPERPRPRSTYQRPVVHPTDERGQIIRAPSPALPIAVPVSATAHPVPSLGSELRESRPAVVEQPPLRSPSPEHRGNITSIEVTVCGRIHGGDAIPEVEYQHVWSCCGKRAGYNDERCRARYY